MPCGCRRELHLLPKSIARLYPFPDPRGDQGNSRHANRTAPCADEGTRYCGPMAIKRSHTIFPSR